MSLFLSRFLFLALLFSVDAALAYAQDGEELPSPPDDLPDGPSTDSYVPPPALETSSSGSAGTFSDKGSQEAAKPPEDDGYTDPVVYSAAEKKAACRKFDGKYISYYENVYRVEKCRIREIQSSELILTINKRHTTITPVDSDVLAKLDKGLPIQEESQGKTPFRSCKQLEKKYITFAYTDVYYVERCKKRVFPEWTAFVEHRKKNNRAKEDVIALTYREFMNLENGSEMPSMIDSEYKKQKIMSKHVDVIAIDVACKGLNGKDVSYVDRIYKIENCRKRAYDPEQFMRKRQASAARMIEMTSEQWISMPEGKPIDLSGPKPKAKKTK